MIDINELRRLVQAATPGPWHATKSVETNSWAVWSDTTRLMELRPTKTVDMYRVSNTAAFIAAANPAAISKLLDRLEAAESALSNLGVTPEEAKEGLARHKATLARLEAAEKERELLRARNDFADEAIGHITQERDALRAKVAEMEQQEPECEVVGQVRNVLYEVRTLKYDLPAGAKLYALPGAQPAPSVPDGWQLVPIEPTIHMCIQGDNSRANIDDCTRTPAIYRAMLAAAPKPEAKP